MDGPFKGRLVWNGSKDLQDLSIVILNVTLNDSGLYQCQVSREFDFRFFTPTFSITKNISLTVKEKGQCLTFFTLLGGRVWIFDKFVNQFSIINF